LPYERVKLEVVPVASVSNGVVVLAIALQVFHDSFDHHTRGM
jgi:hypothetical protein